LSPPFWNFEYYLTTSSKNRLLFFSSKEDVATNRDAVFYNNTALILGTQLAFDELFSKM
jgi:hypothetical protein